MFDWASAEMNSLSEVKLAPTIYDFCLNTDADARFFKTISSAEKLAI